MFTIIVLIKLFSFRITMAATIRTQTELQMKSKKALQKSTDPVERLRLVCLARGANGIKGLAR
jgi:calcyphosin